MQLRKLLSLLRGAWPARPPDEIDDLRRQLAELRRQNMDVLSLVSEMRQPLHAILGYTELIMSNAYGDTTDEMRKVLRRIASNSYQAAGMINTAFERAKKKPGD